MICFSLTIIDFVSKIHCPERIISSEEEYTVFFGDHGLSGWSSLPTTWSENVPQIHWFTVIFPIKIAISGHSHLHPLTLAETRNTGTLGCQLCLSVASPQVTRTHNSGPGQRRQEFLPHSGFLTSNQLNVRSRSAQLLDMNDNLMHLGQNKEEQTRQLIFSKWPTKLGHEPTDPQKGHVR